MIQQHSSSDEELKRFLVVAKKYQQETGKRAFMPACPVDKAWHNMLELPAQYSHFCQQSVGGDVLHETAMGEGEIGWTKVYEELYGPLPEIWFQDINGVLEKEHRQVYLDEGVFRASWDCTPYFLVA